MHARPETRLHAESAAFGLVALAALGAAMACAPVPSVQRAAAPNPSAPPGCANAVPESCRGVQPAYEKEIAPIVLARCLGCHGPQGVAAEDHDFSSIDTIFAQRTSVLAQVSACTMPPPGAPPLPAEEAAEILRWAACGAR
jgi:hypothetical protein